MLLGHIPVCAVEVDPFCRDVLKARQADGSLPSFPIHNDVREFDGTKWRGVEIVAGGFPCQDISVAGKGTGLSGSRSSLWFEMLRIIGEVEPHTVFIENAPAIRTRGLGTVLEGLAAIGFDAEWGVLSAEEVGAPHLRKRMWILASHPERYASGHIEQRPSRRWLNLQDGGQADARHDGEEGHLPDTDCELRDRSLVEGAPRRSESADVCRQDPNTDGPLESQERASDDSEPRQREAEQGGPVERARTGAVDRTLGGQDPTRTSSHRSKRVVDDSNESTEERQDPNTDCRRQQIQREPQPPRIEGPQRREPHRLCEEWKQPDSPVADPASGGSIFHQAERQGRQMPGGGSEEVPGTSSAGLPQREGNKAAREQPRTTATRGDAGEISTRLGGASYGLAAWLDGLAIEPWLEGWEDGVPRVTTEKKDRTKRLKAIGNGQVPLCAAVAYMMLRERLEQDDRV
jgi:site-specific DNA-cytosine methylase